MRAVSWARGIEGLMRGRGFDQPAFALAGALTYGSVRLIYWRHKVEGVPRVFGHGVPAALAWGGALGALAAATGLAYLRLATRLVPLPENLRDAAGLGPGARAWIAVLAVGAAPIFEEFIFRGLVFGGLRRPLGLGPSALASAALFAFIHPPFSIVPVFGLGICAALAYERAGILLAPMTVHALYNAAILWIRLGEKAA
jgi:membrane protease YdiL (CAAX protease family)